MNGSSVALALLFVLRLKGSGFFAVAAFARFDDFELMCRARSACCSSRRIDVVVGPVW